MKHTIKILSIVLFSLLMLLAAISLTAATAPTQPQAPGPVCSVGSGGYFSAIGPALAAPSCTTITIAAGNYKGNLTIDRDVVLVGEDAATTIIDGNGGFTNQRVISITTDQRVAISNVTIQNGLAITPAHTGGGIWNRGYLTLTRVILTHNTASGSDVGGAISPGEDAGRRLVMDECIVSHNTADRGGGIFFNAPVEIRNTLFYSNTAKSGSGLLVYSSTVLVNVTFSDNQAITSTGSGAALAVDGWSGSPTTAILTNCTFAGNAGAYTLYGNAVDAEVILANTLVTASSSGSCFATTTSNGHNIDRLDGCQFRGPGDQYYTDPLLGPLADNGGFAWTHAITSASPATDAGDDARCPATDQRGRSRPGIGTAGSTAHCDVGAYEYHLADDLHQKVYMPLTLRDAN